MALQTSGQISLNDVNVEIGNSGTSQIDMNSSAVRGLLERPSGQISLSDGYGKSSVFVFTISSNTQEANLSTLATAAGWDGSAEVEATVASGVYLWSNSTSTAGLTVNIAGATITNNGYIIGKGGKGGSRSGNNAGSGLTGGPALSVASTSVTVVNNSGAYIAGGGGGGAASEDDASDFAGGGGGAGGGAGGDTGKTNGSGGAGGAIGATGADALDIVSDDDGTIVTYLGGHGGGAGGGSGVCDGTGGNTGSTGGGGGGRILPGVGGSPNAAGGSGGAAGAYGNYNRGGGGGGWGASGGNSQDASGGAGGAAITGTAISLTNNGTIYGST